MDPVITDLDALSNRAMDAIEAGNYVEAEKLCARLLIDYPQVFDGRHRMGMLREAQGRFREAADHYARVLDMIKLDPTNTDDETVRYFTEDLDRALKKAKG